MNPRILFVLAALARLPVRYAFTEAELLTRLRDLETGDSAQRPFNWLSADLLREALIAAAQAGVLREVEFPPGVFLIVRTRMELRPEADLSDALVRRLEAGALGIDQPDGPGLERALAVPVETVSLRRAVLDSEQFTWPAEDHAALMDAAARLPEER